MSNKLRWHNRKWWSLLIDLSLALLTIAVQTYLTLNLERYSEVVIDITAADLFFGSSLIILVIEATRRSFGLVMSGLGVFFIVHPLFGQYFPGFFKVPTTTVENLVYELFISANGIYGLAIGVFLTYIVVFVLFSSMVNETKAGAFFNSLATGLMGTKNRWTGKNRRFVKWFHGNHFWKWGRECSDDGNGNNPIND